MTIKLKFILNYKYLILKINEYHTIKILQDLQIKI